MSHDTTDAYHAERIRAQIALADRIPAPVADCLACWSMHRTADGDYHRAAKIRSDANDWHITLHDDDGRIAVSVEHIVEGDDWSPLIDLLHHWSPPT